MRGYALSDEPEPSVTPHPPRLRLGPSLSLRERCSLDAPKEGAFRPSNGGRLGTPPRPILLLDPPEPVEAIAQAPDGAPARFTWRRAPRRVIRAEGPERLAAEWWRVDTPALLGRTRDYYRLEDDQGRRYWLFREGLYGREDADRALSWWMHGVFA